MSIRHFRLVARNFWLFLASLSFACLAGATAQAQEDMTPKRGFHPAGSYAVGDVETINTANGNLLLGIPLTGLPQGRGGHPGAALKLLYNSKLLDSRAEIHHDPLDPSNNYSYNILQASDKGGWRYGLLYQLEFINREDSYANNLPQCPANEAIYKFKLSMTFPDGSTHEFRPTGYSDYLNDGYYQINYDGWLANCSGGGGYYAVTTGMNYYSTDGSYLRLFIAYDGDGNPWNNAWTLYSPDGGRVTGGNAPQRIYDSNNNYVEIEGVTLMSGNPATKVTDQLGRYFTVEYGSGQGGSTWYDYIVSTGVNNQSLQWTITWKSNWVYKDYIATLDLLPDPPGTHKELFTSIAVVDQITLPSQAGSLTYTFSYNGGATQPSSGNYTYGWGELSQMTLPSGAQTSYEYLSSGDNGIWWTDALENYPTEKELTYNLEYDCGSSPCSSNPTTETWTYLLVPNNYTQITAPNGGVTTETFSGYSPPAWESGLAYKTESPDGSVVERIWQRNIPYAAQASNPYVKTEFVSIKDSGGTLVKTAIKDYSYDKNGNVTQVDEYDWVAYGDVPRSSGRPTGIPGGATLKRRTVNTYYNPTPDASNTGTDDSDVYHKTSSPNIKRSLESSEVGTLSTVLSRTESFYDNAATTGNLTSQKSWDSTKGAISYPLVSGNSITVSHTYDGYGNSTLTTDANGDQAQFTYGTIGGFSGLYVTQTKTAYGTSVERTTNSTYDFHTGLVLTTTDADNSVTNKTTYDVFGRPTLVEEADGVSGVERQTATEYDDDERYVIVRADLNTTGDQKLVSIQHYDQLGRVRLSRSLEDASTQSATNEQHGIKVQTRYYAGTSANQNSYGLVSAPYRAATSGGAGGEAEMAWRRTKSDQGGKIIELETFAGASLPAPWGSNTTSTGKVTTAYDAEFTTVTDQVNRSRRSVVDGLGRLVRMDEPDAASGSLGTTASPVQPTNYTYNALDKLTQSVQGSQTRTFNYSSLTRLTSATNPENGTVSYTYDNNGNLYTKTDARGVVSTYTYDQLNRNTSITYSGGASPAIQRYYDGATKGKGKLWYSLSYNVHPTSGQLAYSYTIVDSYDEMGRAKTGSHNFLTNNGTTWMSYPISRTFDVAGNVKTQSYPSTRGTSYNYDNAGRISSFSGTVGDGVSRTYADSFLFNAQGQIKRERFGTTTALYHNIHYNSRGQAVDIRLGTNSADEWHWNRGALITYFSNQARNAGNAFLNASDNNGNVTMQEHYVPTDDAISSYAIPLRDTYEYDYLNRVTQANGVQRTTGGSWPSVYAQHFSYDRWGNRWINSGGTWGTNIFNTVITPNSANNRLTGMTYDSAGNTTNDPITGGGARTYDAENKMISAQSGATWNYYVYDADGKRVRRIVAGTETWHVYGFSGELLAEYPVNGAANAPSKEYANGGQTMIVGDSTNVRWTVADSLGTPRIVVGKTGALSDVTRHDYLPFGEELFVGMGTGSIRTTGMGYANSGTNDGIRKKFTGYERDDETGLDYAQARYYSSKQGRFTSPDEFTGGPAELYDFADVASDNPTFYADLIEPQSLNKYQYTYNNPLRYTDPDGHGIETLWDAANVALGVASFVKNVKDGKVGAAIVDAVGVVVDSAATVVPFVPGGVGTIIKVARGADKVVNVVKAGDKVADVSKAVNKVEKGADAAGTGATLTAKTANKKAIVIGENMKDRVKPHAESIGATYYKPRNWSMANNKRWIKKVKKEGREIIDIGIDPKRAQRSEAYEMEKKELAK